MLLVESNSRSVVDELRKAWKVRNFGCVRFSDGSTAPAGGEGEAVLHAVPTAILNLFH